MNERQSVFWIWLTVLVAAAVGHSMWATSLDGFTIDEAYHIAAGATYVRWGDFRVNPEHPPLVKLAAGLAASPGVLHLTPPKVFVGKEQERVYTQTAVYVNSDGRAVQRRARAALFCLNALLLGVLGLVMRRLLGPAVALATVGLLALEPTVSAHMPVVMTDLPMALLGATTCCLALLVVRDGRWIDWAWLGLAMGLLAGTKHSAPLILLPVLAICTAGLVWRVMRGTWSWHRLAGLALAVMLSFATLWALYGFRYEETPVAKGQAAQETFNKTLDLKVADLHSPVLKWTLNRAAKLHLLPRAYLWGMADTLRAGVEGRPGWVKAFGRDYRGKAPFWVPFAFLAVKSPVGFLVLVGGGLWLLVTGRLESGARLPMAVLGGVWVWFMGFIGLNGIYYAGVRHWLFAVPLMAVFAGAFLVHAWRSRQQSQRWVAGVALAAIAISVLPQRRIWEYHNELAGGSRNAWRWFNNESVDLGQRSPEILAYFNSHIAPGEPLMNYWTSEEEMKAGRMKPWEPTPEQVGDGHISGWFIFSGPAMASRNWLHKESMRGVTPVARFGNAMIFHGTYYLPYVAAGTLGYKAKLELHRPGGDMKLVESLLLREAALKPDAPGAHVLLGNFALGRGERDAALAWYRRALPHVDPQTKLDIEAQIRRVEKSPAGAVGPMRDPFEE